MNENRPNSRSARQRVERLQAAFKPFRAVKRSVVDDFIAERQAAGSKENVEELQDLNSGSTPSPPRFH